MADLLMPETQQPIIVILIIHSYYFLQVLVELQEYRILCKLYTSNFLLVSLQCTFYYTLRPLIHWAPGLMQLTSLCYYVCNVYVTQTNMQLSMTIYIHVNVCDLHCLFTAYSFDLNRKLYIITNTITIWKTRYMNMFKYAMYHTYKSYHCYSCLSSYVMAVILKLVMKTHMRK